MQKTLAKANKLKLVEKATLSSIAMLLIPTGLIIVQNDRLVGTVLVVLGVALVAFREYIKLRKWG